MPRDYKHRASRRRKRRSLPGWAWLTAGLALGLFIAFLVWLGGRPQNPATPVAAGGRPPSAPAAPRQRTPKALPPAPKPRFDFYSILPEMEVVVPEQAITGRPRAGVAQVEQPGVYLLQAGSFRTLGQADQLKAQLALLGLEPSIQTVTINGRDTWHRVRLGPFRDLKTLNAIRARLKEHHIDAILLKVKG
ncbi:SPOR domain-containing protein [Thiohalobacter sp. IOR34]|uniref:SPOR domain-containing protein n=1 Tax=Thiohalobacter sp. IOR34 TaxID=3057176 RepID=UPI0025B12625|nr:SPOR domain-containing protein [Thiohalobacter sp. IOR34]WJW75666.1 SPOR domain-containing protein [Thiohalobacter sp. IOR34]